MPSKMTELASLCDKLASGKSLERKKAADRIKSLLSISAVLKQLDESNSQDGFGICWDSVFEAAGAALLSELKSQRSTSTSSIKQPEMYGVVKFVLHQASLNGKPMLKAEVVFEHMTVVLSDYPHILASEYAFLISNYFLVPTLWKDWANPDLHTLSKILLKYIKGFNKASRGFKAGPISLAIERITVYLLQRIDMRPMKFLIHFKEFFLKTSESNSQTLQHMLASVNLLSEKGAVNSCLHLAQFGRDIAMRLLLLWKGCRDDVFKLEAVRFFRLQLVANEQNPETTNTVWEDVLWKLYEVLCFEVGNARTSLRLAGDKLPSLWTDEFVNLLAHVCRILLPDGERLGEVSQSVAKSQYSGSRPTKRRRVQSGWESLKSNLLDSKDYQAQIVWIRVIKAIVEQRAGNSLREEQLRDTLDVMLQILSNTRRSNVLKELRDVLLVLANQRELQSADSDRLWNKATVLSISLVERNQTDFYDLLSHLLMNGKLQHKTQIISLIKRSSASPVSSQSLCWLSHFLSKYELSLWTVLSPSEWELETAASDTGQREELWQHTWLMRQLLKTINYEEGLCRVVIASETAPARLFGRVMAALVCKDSQTPCAEDKKLCPSTLQSLVEMQRSMAFVSEVIAAAEPVPGKTAYPDILQGAADQANSLLVNKVQLATRLLDQRENQIEYMEDSLWLLEMILTYLSSIGADAARDDKLLKPLQVFWAKLAERLREHLGLTSEKPYLCHLLAVISLGGSWLSLQKDLCSALISYVHTVLDKTTLSQSSQHSISSSDSSGSTFAIPELPEVSRKPISESVNLLTAPSDSEKQLLAALQILVHYSAQQNQFYDDILSLATKASSEKPSLVQIILQTFSLSASLWQCADHTTVLTLLFHLRGLIETYHTEPHMGVACLEVLNKLISMVSAATSLTAEEKEDIGGKIFVIVNGLVLKLYERKDDDGDCSFQLFPMYNVEYRLVLMDTLQLLIKADSKHDWKSNASRQTAIQLDPKTYLIKALLDRDYTVRNAAIQHIDAIFHKYSEGASVELSSNEQEKWFDDIYKDIRNILEVNATMSDIDKMDEARTRTATLLSLFQKIAFCSPACSKKSLCALFLCLNKENKHIDSILLSRVLGCAISKSPYTSTAELCELNLGYIAKEWVAMEYKLAAFPIDLFGYEDIGRFYKDHQSMFVSVTFGNEAVWEDLLNLLSSDADSLTRSELPSLVQAILPRLANNFSNAGHSKDSLDQLKRLLGHGVCSACSCL
ncbi:serine-protein kinase ATM-like [Watersipora subatra]|uniref:serine-protein kinase ATM-like n=1 Tax=Watersipora subatra TaxID=2589382 RepID=UPI00355C1254